MLNKNRCSIDVKLIWYGNVKNNSVLVRFVVNTMTDFSQKQLVNSLMQLLQ